MKNNLEKIRNKLKISQEQLARLINVSSTTIRNIEKNRSIPSVDIAIKIKKILKVKDIEEIFEIEE